MLMNMDLIKEASVLHDDDDGNDNHVEKSLHMIAMMTVTMLPIVGVSLVVQWKTSSVACFASPASSAVFLACEATQRQPYAQLSLCVGAKTDASQCALPGKAAGTF